MRANLAVVTSLSLFLSLPVSAHEGHEHADDPVQAEEGHDHDHEGSEEGHNHEHEHEGEASSFDTESYLFTLKGVQPFGEDCYLGVVSEGKTRDGVYYADVETSFQHEGEGPGRLRVLFDTKTPDRLIGSTSEGAQISIQLEEKALTPVDAIRYAVKWAHENHTDTGICSELKLIHDASKEEQPTPPETAPNTPPTSGTDNGLATH